MLVKKNISLNNLFNIAEKEEFVTLKFRSISVLKNLKEEAKMKKILSKDYHNLKRLKTQAPPNTKRTIPL